MIVTIIVVFVAAATIVTTVLILLRGFGIIGPTADTEAWSVRSKDAERERATVDARLRALRVEADVLTRKYVAPPARREKSDA